MIINPRVTDLSGLRDDEEPRFLRLQFIREFPADSPHLMTALDAGIGEMFVHHKIKLAQILEREPFGTKSRSWVRLAKNRIAFRHQVMNPHTREEVVPSASHWLSVY